MGGSVAKFEAPHHYYYSQECIKNMEALAELPGESIALCSAGHSSGVAAAGSLG